MADPIRPSLPPGLPPAIEPRPGLASTITAALGDAVTPPAPAPGAAVATARAEAAAQQTGLGPVIANLEQALGAGTLPPAARAAIEQVLALRLLTDAPIDAEAVRRAVAGSGLFLEARLATGAAPPMDLKAALLVLQQALAPGPQRAATRPQKPGPPPPTPGGATTAQAPARPAPDLDAEPAAMLERLGGEVAQALARQTLHQLASVPDGPGARWMFELPLATPQGPAIAQFAIDQDDRGHAAPDAGPAWQARFSLNLPPLGPVHVDLQMRGERTAVTVWAEQAEGLERLRGRGGELAGALAADVVFRPGAPRPPETLPGRLLDRTS